MNTVPTRFSCGRLCDLLITLTEYSSTSSESAGDCEPSSSKFEASILQVFSVEFGFHRGFQIEISPMCVSWDTTK